MSQTHFYGTRNDLMPLLEQFERNVSIKYVRFDVYDLPASPSYECGADIPNLGIADNEMAISCAAYLVCHRSAELRARRIDLYDGGVRYAYDQLINPETIELAPGGLWREGILLNGRFGSASQSDFSQTMMRRARSSLKKMWKRIKSYYVGPEAEQMLLAGKRLTTGEKTPRDYDLAI